MYRISSSLLVNLFITSLYSLYFCTFSIVLLREGAAEAEAVAITIYISKSLIILLNIIKLYKTY